MAAPTQSGPFSAYRKFVVALVTAGASALSLGLIPDPWADWTTVVIAGLGAIGVYAVPNAPQA